MLLVNAIYFKGLWRYPFNETDTTTDVFHVTPTQSVTVPFMTMERDLYFTESVELDSAILRLPYMVSVKLCPTAFTEFPSLSNPKGSDDGNL
jgi:serine protease inhibitor